MERAVPAFDAQAAILLSIIANSAGVPFETGAVHFRRHRIFILATTSAVHTALPIYQKALQTADLQSPVLPG
jgi:hypothetical protein